jgi:hypothetical protein
MPKFIVEQDEVHTFKYTVEAKNRGEAIAKVLDGDGEAMDGGSEFVENADNLGMSTRKLTKEEMDSLEENGFDFSDKVESIRSVEQID